jgi:hypothetical protein
MKLYSYVVKHDSGFAPNPFWGYCTLACCKPKIRKAAEVGDWVVGTGAVSNVGNDKLVYAMKVTEKLNFEQYSQDKRFQCKIPAKGRMEERGDNIYHSDKNRDYMQCKSYHIEKDKKRDLSSGFVLISNYYFYFGKKDVLIPNDFKVIIKSGPGHKCNFDSNLVSGFINWLESNFPKGIQGEPFDYKERLFNRLSASSCL